jgi:hypothetical protein
LATQLDKILEKVPELLKIELTNPPNAGEEIQITMQEVETVIHRRASQQTFLHF